jgi:hypothetical protein
MILRALAVLVLVPLPLTVRHGSAPSPPHNVLVARGRTEPSIAVDPRNGQNIIISTNTDYSQPVGGTYPTGSFASHDGGRSFSALAAPQVWPYTTGADSSVAIDGHGTVFYTYLGETPAYCSGGRSGVVVTHSIDAGRSYRPARMVDNDPEDDKPFMGVETRKSGPSHIFLSWTRWKDSPSGSEIWFTRSGDGGVHFSAPVRMQRTARDSVGSVPVIGPHGRVYVFWMSYPEASDGVATSGQVLGRISTDDGRHFGRVHSVGGRFTRLPFMLAPGSLRVLSSPAATVAPDGAVYVVWAEASSIGEGGAVASDIVLSRSLDGGAHWSAPVRVNDVRNGDRFMPAVSVLSDGSVGVAFYDRRLGANRLDVYAARVRFDGGTHVSANIRVNAGPAPVSDIQYLPPGSTCFLPGRFFGDYIGAAGDRSGGLCVTWADTQLRVQDETDIWFARVRFGG